MKVDPLRKLGEPNIHMVSFFLKSLFSKVCVRLTGFKPIRFKQWQVVIKIEGRRAGYPAIARLLAQDALSRVGLGGSSGKAVWRVGMRECGRCAVYNPGTKACRDNLGAGTGCGCFMPFKRLAPGVTCWLKQIRSK